MLAEIINQFIGFPHYVDGALFSLNFSFTIITMIVFFPFSVFMSCRKDSRNESDCS